MPTNKPSTETPIAPATAVQTPPRRFERQGSKSEAYSRRLPQVRGGVCEFCGVLDPNVPSEHQYKLCPHYRDMGQLFCTYCDGTRDPDEVVGMSAFNVAENPDNPGTWIAWCDRYECSRKHEARFKRN